MTTENTVHPEVEIDRLRQKNAELLNEVKQHKARVKELEASAEGGTKELEALRAELADLKINKPVAELLSGVLVSPKYAALELAEHYKFELNDQGVIEMREIDGTPVMIKEKVDGREVERPIKIEEQEVWRFLSERGGLDHIIRGSRATGGGAPGDRVPSSSYSAPKEPTQPAQKSSFGLK